MRLADSDRRKWDRVDLVKPAKVFLPACSRFAAARTCNLSRGGALLTIESARPLAPGDPIDLSVFFARLPMVPADRMIRGRVTRAQAFDTDRQLVAIRFDEPLEQLAAA
jgi:hypothetical protein